MDEKKAAAAIAVREDIDAFVARHFRLAGTLRLHSAALGWDLLRAPLNVALAPVYLLTGIAALLARLVRLRRLGDWLAARRILLPTSVSRAVQSRIEAELLKAAPLSEESRRIIADYTAVRSAVAEITTSLIVLSAGLALFGTATPGIASLAPSVSEYVVHASAVENFPLGVRLGRVWYGTFPVSQPLWFVLATGFGLAMIASVVTTFAGIIADPVQARLGIHRRRLLTLMTRISATEGRPAGIAPEHILARFADLTDAAISALRFFRP
ncbi:hypothetical protein LX81_01643 [Palleronia aestuarii]|uniref:Uncharacterized protein n=1 Tax=Palleronia aestuarii TaxID=568105 RepID=A0A2W7NBK7_9RHOB|nr:DUF6635 family protein [Palleronia aestuarii]PZX17013.1 hypothetical protein LX81_01643 [Palleronia aestuarii]